MILYSGTGPVLYKFVITMSVNILVMSFFLGQESEPPWLSPQSAVLFCENLMQL
jgi:hypothetical protein